MRVIKRKIIWDPDVPETKKSFAQYASTKASCPAPTTPKTTVKSISPTTTTKKEVAPKKRSATPTARSTKAGTPVGGTERGPSPVKRRAQTPNTGLANGGTQKKKKVSEIDRLMGDEGAANMIHAVEHEQRELSGGEVSNKPLMRKRAMTITGRVSTSTIEIRDTYYRLSNIYDFPIQEPGSTSCCGTNTAQKRVSTIGRQTNAC